MIRLFILIRSLEVGGAERQLVELVKALDKTRFAITLATFYNGGGLRSELQSLEGVNLISLHKKGRWDIVPFGMRLMRVVRRGRPHIVMGSMGIANELSLLAGRLARSKVVWGLRASNVDFSHYSRISRWSFRVGAFLSGFADLIIVNSHKGMSHHIAHGYSGKHMVVIPNGTNTRTFRPDARAGAELRAEWNVAQDDVLIGVAGRLDPMKDHNTFLQAAALLAGRHSEVRFVCVGDGPDEYKAQLTRLASTLGLENRLVWAGRRSDMATAYNAMDIACSSSSGEGMPNVIAEAMACCVPCVVTDVGDSARLVGDRTWVVPPKDPTALCMRLEKLATMSKDERTSLGDAARQRVIREYSVEQLARRTEAALLRIVRCDR